MLLLRVSTRYLRQHPWFSLLTILGVALGVAVVIAIDIANNSAMRAFERSTETLAGRTTHQILGGPLGISESSYFNLRRAGWRDVSPIVEGYARLPDPSTRALHIIGIDPLAESRFREQGEQVGKREGLSEFLTQPGAVLLTESTANELGLHKGSALPLEIAGQAKTVTMVGTIRATTQDIAALNDVLLTDIATAQELLTMVGTLTRIDLIAPPTADEKYWASLRAALPLDSEVVPVNSAQGSLAQMTNAFRTNLTAMSLLALVVGMFIIFNSLTFSVVRRRALFGSLRALGVTRGEIWFLVMGEALLIAVGASLLGALLGVALGQGLLSMVARTINDLYFVLDVTGLSVDGWTLFKGIGLGIGATLFAAAMPALEATRTPPRAVMYRSDIESRVGKLVPLLRRVAYGGFVLCAVLLLWPSRSLFLSFTALFVLILSYSLWSPSGVLWLGRLLQRLAGDWFGLLGKMAVHSVNRSLSRTGIAIAALMVCVATTLGVSIMISSFRDSVSTWISDALRADLYISKPATGYSSAALALPDDFIVRVRALPQIDALSLGSRAATTNAGTRTDLLVMDLPRSGFEGFHFLEGEPESAWQDFTQQQAVLVSEPYAYRHNLTLSDTVRLRTNVGEHDFRVAGIYTDYASEQGTVVLHRSTYKQFWGEAIVATLGLYLKPGADSSTVMQEIRALAEPGQTLLMRSNQDIRERTLQVFDRTFAITEVLRLLTIVVAFVGILSALMAVQLERAREYGVLRATGLTPGQLRVAVIAETAVMGLIAGILAIPLGLLLSALLIVVINRRSFGWSMGMEFDVVHISGALLLALIAALLAGIYPAEKMARSSPASALRDE